MTAGRRATISAAVVAAGLVAGLVAGCGSSAAEGDVSPVVIHSQSGQGGPYAGIEVDPPYGLTPVTLTDADGQQVRVPDDLDGTVRVFFYGYTHCPDVCPLIMSDLTVAVARLPDEVASDVEVVLVTSDPARDDPATLRDYLSRYDPDFTGLTGDLDTIVAMAEQMGVPIEQGRRLPSGGYEVGHGAQVVGAVGARAPVVWSEGTSAEDIANDLILLAEQGR